MAKELDCRGLACPAPVLQAKEFIEQEHPESLIVLVDNEAARQNVSRFLSTQHFTVAVEENEGQFRITGTQTASPYQSPEPAASPGAAEKKIMVMVATDHMGAGDDELGRKLLFNFLKTLKEMGPDLWRLVFVNNGVKLTIEGAETLSLLQELARKGVTILVCGTCLDHFKLLGKKQVGETTNMLDIVTAMQLADSVVNIWGNGAPMDGEVDRSVASNHKNEVFVTDEGAFVHPEMTVLDVVSMDRRTESVFKRYDTKVGGCLCCQALFETLSSVTVRYGLDLNQLIRELREVCA